MAVAPPNLTNARRQWLAELYEANSVAVFNFCRRLLDSREDAADATQEVFLRAASSLTEAPDSTQARAWLMTVARNYCIDLLRRRERFGSAMVTLAATADAGSDAVTTVEDRELLLTVLQQMGVRERAALWQSAVEQRPLADIARSSGMSYLAAAKLVSRARHAALLIATRLAVVLGLASLGRWAARRSSVLQRSQQLAALVAIPAVIGLAVVATSPHTTIVAQAKPAQLVVVHTPVPTVQASAPPVVNNPAPAPSPSPSPGLPAPAASRAPIATGAVLAANVVVVKAPTAPRVVQPTPSPPPTVSDEKDHGKGRDHDDLPRVPPGNGLALGHGK